MWEVVFELLGKVGEWTVNRVGERIVVKELKKPKDKDIDNTLDLYERLFKEEHRVAPSDLVEWLRKKDQGGNQPNLEHCLLIAKHKAKTVGILKVLYSREQKYALICYFGIDKEHAITRSIAGKLLLRFFRKYLDKRWCDCDGLVFEIDLPHPGLTKEEKTERTARIRLFQDIARQHGHDVCQIAFDYYQPKMGDSFRSAAKERKMGLMLVPIKKCESECICRPDFDRLLKFLIFGVYGSTQKIAAQKKQAYNSYLNRLFESMTQDITGEVQLDR
jgi:hypothetical protein